MRARRVGMALGVVVLMAVGPLVPSARAGDAPAPLTGAVQIDVGFQATCAVLEDNTAACWGSGAIGQNDITQGESNVALPVLDAQSQVLTGITQISVSSSGRFACVRLVDATAQCWGFNGSGNLGDGTTTDRVGPVVVQQPGGGGPLTDVESLAAGSEHACAVLTNGQVRCWGRNSGDFLADNGGALGDGTATNRSLPVVVRNGVGTGPLTGVTQVVAAEAHTCAVSSAGTVRCWGANNRAQLGDGTRTSRRLPSIVKAPTGGGSLTNVVELATEDVHTCARTTGGQMRCWGPNDDGQRGNGTVMRDGQIAPLRPTVVLAPTGTDPLTSVRAVGVGAGRSCARVGSTNQARCWGTNGFGGVGDGTRSERLRARTVRNVANTGPLKGVRALDGGLHHTCALLTNTNVACFGLNGSGEVGDGTTAMFRTTPRLVVAGG